MGRIIVIAGFAESTRDRSNHETPDVEIWALNRAYTFLKRWTRHYEVHQPDLYTGKTGLREPGYLKMLAESKAPVYMQVPTPEVPNAIQFPLAEIKAAGFRDYFTTSIAYMIAHALYEHKVLGQTVDELRLYGIDMSAFSEYSYQKPCVEYYLGVAEGMGIKVTVPKQSPVLKGPGYGTSEYKHLWEAAKDRIAHIKSKQTDVAAQLQAVMGAQSEYSHIPKELPELTDKLSKSANGNTELGAIKDTLVDVDKKIRARVTELTKAQSQLNADLNATLGALREAQQWLVIVGAPQTADQEPESVKLPQI